jgi:hypothetical protein
MKKLIFILFSALAFGQSPSHYVQGNQQAVTGTAAQLPSFVANAICVKVVPGGTQTVYIGDSTVSTSNGFPLAAGDGTCFSIPNLNLLYAVAGSAGSRLAWYGMQN